MNPADPQGLLRFRQCLITLKDQIDGLLEHPLLQEGAGPDIEQQGSMLEAGHRVVGAAFSVEWALHQLSMQVDPPNENEDEHSDLNWEIDRGPDEF